MKKTTLILAFIMAFSISIFADEGHVPIGGRSCPNGQTCLIDFESTESEPIGLDIKDIFKYLKSIFE